MQLPCFGLTEELLDIYGEETDVPSEIISLLPILCAVRIVGKAFSTLYGNLPEVLHFFGI